MRASQLVSKGTCNKGSPWPGIKPFLHPQPPFATNRARGLCPEPGATTDVPGAAGMSPTPLQNAIIRGVPRAVAPAHVPKYHQCPPSPAAVSPRQHPKIRSSSGGAPLTLFSQLWDRRDPAPAVLGGRDGCRPAQGQQLTPALTAASKMSDRTHWGTQQLRKRGMDAVRSVNLQMRTLGAGVWPQATRLPAGA